MNICSIDNCKLKVYGYGYCKNHWYSWKMHGDPLVSREYIRGGGTGQCTVEYCDKPVRAKKYCIKHLGRFSKYGDPLITLHNPPGSGGNSSQGYITIRGQLEHRQIIENFLGRKLLSTEEVHHLDGNKSNNRLSNLIVLSKRDHAKLHAYLSTIWKRLSLPQSD